MSDEHPHLSEVIGANVRRIREDNGITLDALATEAKRYGAHWTSGRVFRIESGETKAVSVELLVLLPLVLSNLAQMEVALPDLLETDGPVVMQPGVVIYPRDIADTLSGGDPREIRVKSAPSKPDAPSLADARAAAKLGWDLDTFTERSLALWGRPLFEEAKARAPEGATAQKIGHQTRALLWEIAKHGWKDTK